MSRVWAYLWLWTALLAPWPALALTLDVRETVWNFDGRVVPEHFNLLSVRVTNPDITPFDGALRLLKIQGLDQGVGAACVQPCYLSPGSARWVQFHVYVTRESQWRLVWGRRAEEKVDLSAPKLGPPARVLLLDPQRVGARQSRFPAFPDQLFPATVAATDGLDSVLLDYAPRWEAAKRAAFLDWLRRGGTVHVLRDSQGHYPVFADELALLNVNEARTPAGAGLIVRQPLTRDAITEQHLKAQGFAEPRFEKSNEATVWQLSDTLFRPLSQLAQPRHSWWLINILVVVYMLIIGPGILLLARRRRDYRQVLLALVGCVGLFSGLFAYVGRRGQGEAGAVHSLAYARALGTGHYQVTQWVNVFVTRGDYYTLTHGATHNLYAVSQDYERVNGIIQSGKDGRFMVDIPVFSQRSLMHQGTMTGPRLEFPAFAWPTTPRYEPPPLPVGPEFPGAPLAAWVLYNGQIWSLRLDNGRLVPAGSGQSVDSFFISLRGTAVNYMYPQNNGAATATARDEIYRKLAPYVMAWSLGGTRLFHQYLAPIPEAKERPRLFVLAPSPESFHLHSTPVVGTETGFTLYDIELKRPPPP